MDFTLSTAAALSFVPAVSLIINVRFNHNASVKDIKRHQRASLQKYSTNLVTTLWDYTDLQVRYLNERLIIQNKINQEEEIDEAHSKFVYQMKEDLMHMKIDLRRKVWNSQIEISKYDFPKLRNRVAKSFLAIDVYATSFDLENVNNLNEVKIKILESNLSREIKDLIKDFGRQIDYLTVEIDNTNLWSDLKKSFTRLKMMGRKKKSQKNDEARKVFGDTTNVYSIDPEILSKRSSE